MEIHITWALIIVFAVLMYTIFDGFDLGTGILLLFIKSDKERDVMVDTITPVWDGNESWIVLAGVGLFGGFPIAYSVILPALYLPFIVMVLSLAFRGVSMEFRFLSKHHKPGWDIVFSAGSIVAAFCQGIILGNLLDGIEPRTIVNADRINPLYFLTPFASIMGLLVVLLYAMIGCSWLNYKTQGLLQRKFRKAGTRIIGTFTVCSILILILRKNAAAFAPRLAYHGTYDHLSLPLAFWYAIACMILLVQVISINQKRDFLPFLLNILLFIFLGIFVIAHLWPFVIPPGFNLYTIGAPAYGNKILLYAALIVIPVILCYLTYSYIVFKGKTTGRNKYEPALQNDLEALHKKGKKSLKVVPKITRLKWPVRVLLSISWLMLFFIVLGFLGDAAALGIIFTLNIAFLFFWYKSSKQSEYIDQP